MTHAVHHEHLLNELTEQLKPLFDTSAQAIYLYLDDTHKTCNKKFSELLGYTTVEKWIANEYPVEDVAEYDRDKVIQAYINASQNLTASTLQADCVRLDGKTIKTEIIMVPIPFKNETFVLHFITASESKQTLKN